MGGVAAYFAGFGNGCIIDRLAADERLGVCLGQGQQGRQRFEVVLAVGVDLYGVGEACGLG